MKVYYTSADLWLNADLEYVALDSLENTGAFGRLWHDLSAAFATRGSQTIHLAPGKVVYFLGGRDSLVEQLGALYRAAIGTTPPGQLAVAARSGFEVAVQTRINQVGRTISNTVTMGVGTAAQNVGNAFLKLGGMIRGEDPDNVKVMGGASLVTPLSRELVDLQQKTLTIVCVYNSDTNGRAAPAGGGGTKKTGVINQPLTFSGLATLLKGFW
jgi:hypothetical protein